MAAPYLIKRRATWYLRVRVPADLRPIFGNHLTRTLATRDYDFARRQAVGAVARVQAFWREAREIVVEEWMGRPIDEVGENEVFACLRDKAKGCDQFKQLSHEAQVRVNARLADVVIAKQEEVYEERIELELIRAAVAACEAMQQEKKLEHLRGRAEALEETVRILAAGVAPLPTTAPSSGLIPATEPPLPPNAKSADALHPWTEFKTAFVAFRSPGPSQKANYDLAFGRLEQVIGTKSLCDVTMEDIQAYRDFIVSKAKPRAGRSAPSAANIQKLLSPIKTFYAWAASEGKLIKTSPAEKVFLTPGQRKDGKAVKKLPYSKEELETIFHAPLFTGCLSRARRLVAGPHVIRDGKFWLPLLALFTGGRLTELSTLATADVVEAEGHKCISINVIPDAEDGADEGGPRVKTEAGVRVLPIHPVLIRLGFLDYVGSRRNKVRLFDDLNYGKFWNEQFLPSVGMARPSLTFHSFRHTYNRALRGLQSDETKNRLMGHAPATIGEVYGGGIDELEAAKFCEQFRIPVDLSHLYPVLKTRR